MAAAQVEAEDGWEDKHHRCKVAADHYGCLGRQERLHEACPVLHGHPSPPVHSRSLTCREKARSAGMGTRTAMKKATMLLMDVSATLVPVRLKHSPIRSCQDRAGTYPEVTEGCGTSLQSKGRLRNSAEVEF